MEVDAAVSQVATQRSTSDIQGKENVPRVMPSITAVTQSLSTLTFPLDASESIFNEKSEMLAGIYKLKQKIGNGTYGIVRAAEDIRQAHQYAVKILNKADMKDAKHIVRVQREIRFLKLLHHPHIVRVQDVFESPNSLFIVMERLTGGELFDYIVAHGRVKEKESRRFFRQIISAVEYCHQNSVIHRDLKPENLLLDEAKNIKLIDLGFANNYKQSQLLETYCGSPNYAAPEMISGQKYNGPEVDVWSLGIILYALVCGYLPFEDKNIRKLCQKIVSGEYVAPTEVSQDCRDIISRLLEVQPSKRAKLDEIFSHKWVKSGYLKPVDSYVPMRNPIDLSNLDESVLARLGQFGFKKDEILKNLGEKSINPIVSTYHLIKELMERNKANKPGSKISHYTYNSPEDIPALRSNLISMSMPNIANSGPSNISTHSNQFLECPPAETQAPRKFSATIPKPPAVSISVRRGSEIPSISPTDIGRPERASLTVAEVCKQSPPRMVSGWFVTYSTTSSKEPEELMTEVKKSLDKHKIEYLRDGWLCGCSTENVKLTVEIVLVSRMGLCGMILKRLKGTTTEYREVCDWILNGVSSSSRPN